jgi:hypothetical protein
VEAVRKRWLLSPDGRWPPGVDDVLDTMKEFSHDIKLKNMSSLLLCLVSDKLSVMRCVGKVTMSAERNKKITDDTIRII